MYWAGRNNWRQIIPQIRGPQALDHDQVVACSELGCTRAGRGHTQLYLRKQQMLMSKAPLCERRASLTEPSPLPSHLRQGAKPERLRTATSDNKPCALRDLTGNKQPFDLPPEAHWQTIQKYYPRYFSFLSNCFYALLFFSGKVISSCTLALNNFKKKQQERKSTFCIVFFFSFLLYFSFLTENSILLYYSQLTIYYDCINIAALCHFDISCSPPSSFPKDLSVKYIKLWLAKKKKILRSKSTTVHERVIDCSCFPTFKGCLLPSMLRLCSSFGITFLPHC